VDWAGALLVGFLLLFSTWSTIPSDNQFFYLDSEGIKHYILTPAVSAFDNAIDRITNVLFTRYDDPWTAYTETAALVVVGVFIVLLTQQTLRLYLLNQMKTLVNLGKISKRINFGDSSKFFSFCESEELKNFLCLNYFSNKKIKFKNLISFKIITIFFVILLLSPFYTYQTFAQDPNSNSTQIFLRSSTTPQISLSSSTSTETLESVRGNFILRDGSKQNPRDDYQTRFGSFSEKIDRSLLEIITSSNPSLAAKNMRTSFQENRLPVYLYVDSQDSIPRLPSNIEVTGSHEKIAVARLTLNEMNQLAQLDSVLRIEMPIRAVPTGHAVSEGVSFSNVDSFHNAGIDGSGVTVAVIDLDFFPNNPEIQPNVISSTLIDAGGFCGGSKACGVPAGSSHGTAVAEIIVDMGPNVDLLLYTIALSVDFNNAVQDAINQGADIIIASLDFPAVGGDGVGPNGHFFRAGTSSVARMVDQAKNNGILVVISAGNQGQVHWKGNYVPSATISLGSYQSLMEFQPLAAGVQKVCLPIIDIGDRYIAAWNDWATTNQDYDLLLFDSGLTTLLGFATNIVQTGTQPPREIIAARGDVGPFNRCLVLASFSSTQNHLFHINVENNGLNPSVRVRAGSIGTPADAVGALAVGAINQATDTLESFSSSGPTDNPRPKPEICGPDNTLSHQPGLDPFFGTSAAAPHVAGGAALLLDQDPTLTATQLQNALINNARFNAAYSVDNLCGANSGALFLPSLPKPPISLSDIPTFKEAVVLLSNYSPIDMPAVSDNVISNSEISVKDTPSISDTASGMGMPMVKDVPTFKEVVVLLSNYSPFDMPAVSDNVISNSKISVKDTPSISDTAGGMGMPMVKDIPTFNEAVVLLSNYSPFDMPAVSDSVVLTHLPISVKDTPEASDSVSGMGMPSVSDVPTFADVVLLLSSISPIDTPTFAEAVSLLSTTKDSPEVSDSATTSSDISQLDVPTFADVVILLSNYSPIDMPTVSDNVISNSEISVKDTPEVSDSATTSSDISPVDVPTFADVVLLLSNYSPIDIPAVSDSVTMSTAISETDSPEVSDSEFVITKGRRSETDSPTVADRVTVTHQPITVQDAPTVADSTILTHPPISVGDIPEISDNVNAVGMQSATDVPDFIDAVVMLTGRSEVDTPAFDDTVNVGTNLSEVDVPTFADIVLLLSSISPIDIPAVSDSVAVRTEISVKDTPKVSDSVTTSPDISPVDVPTFADIVLLLSSLSPIDAPAVTDKVVLTHLPISVKDTPNVSDDALMTTSVLETDFPTVSDDVTTKTSIAETDAPTFSEILSGIGMISKTDSPTIADSVTTSSDISKLDVPTFDDLVILDSSISKVDVPAVSDKAFLTHPPVLTSDSPAVSDSVTTKSDISSDDIPAFNDVVLMLTSLSPTDIPRVSDGVFKNLEEDEQGITNNQEEATATQAKPTLVITSSSAALSTVNVPSEVPNAEFNLEEILTTDVDGNKVASLETPITINAQTSIGQVVIQTPEDFTITGPDNWPGTVHLPQVIPPSSITPPPGLTVDEVVELGFDDIEVMFNKVVSIELFDEAGKTALYSRGGVTNVISTVCPGIDFDTVNAFLSKGGTEVCAINNGDNLLIWTLHFTSFGTASTSSSTGSTGGSTGGASGPSGGSGATRTGPGGSGGGGGGGGSVIGFGGILGDQPRLYEISWDKCNENIMRIVAGPSGPGLSVKVRTSSIGLVPVSLAEDQPYTTKSVFEIALKPDETFAVVHVEGTSGRTSALDQKSLDLRECEGKVVVYTEPEKPIIPVAPKVPTTTAVPFTTPLIPNGSVLKTGYDDNDFDISYLLNNGSIEEMKVDEESKSVTFSLNSDKGEVLISLPRGLINAVADKFIVFDSDSKEIDYEIVESESEYVILKMVLPDGKKEITVSGTSVVPEFGTLVIAIFVVSILVIVAISRTSRLVPKI